MSAGHGVAPAACPFGGLLADEPALVDDLLLLADGFPVTFDGIVRYPLSNQNNPRCKHPVMHNLNASDAPRPGLPPQGTAHRY